MLDIVAATQTDAAVEAAVEFLKEQKDYKIAERFVMASSFATHPRESLVKALLVSTTSRFTSQQHFICYINMELFLVQ